ncbi:MAG: response regulator [Acidobacteria bacterium]|nr:response regulator [Acidobacteriota bacterium]
MPHTLLLADDSVTIQRVIELTFADEDVRVVAVSDGDQAIAQLDAHPPDIVLADIGMPGKNGYEVAQYMRQSPQLQHIPIVLLTGAFEPVDQERAAQAGCDGILQKPFEPQQVVGRVRELLARGSKKEAAADVAWPASTARPAAPADAMPPAPAAAPAPAGSDYFDNLDAAFATLTNAPARPAPPPGELPSVAAPAAGSSEIDWFASQLNAPAAPSGATEPWDLPGPAATIAPDDLPLTTFEAPAVPDDLNLTEAPDAGAEVRGAEVPGAVQGAEVLGATHPAPQHPITLPSIADAFAALLAAEAHDPSPVAPVWPVAGSSLSAPAAPSVDTDELVERVTRRVLDRLSGTAIRDAVADVTSSIAERLVREEIERIKSSIK